MLCAFSIVVCVAMLIGTTFAWFTDVASNKGNVIAAGNLSISVIGYDSLADGSADLDGRAVNFKNSTDPLIGGPNDSNWEPGRSNIKYIKIANTGSLPLKFDLSFASQGGKLGEALWYDFNPVADPTSTTPPAIQRRSIISTADGIDTVSRTGELAPLTEAWYRLDYGMNDCAGNTYMDQNFKVDIHVVATQTNPNAVIGGNIIPAYTLDDILKVNNSDVTCPTVILMNDIEIIQRDIAINKAMNLDLNGYKLTLNHSTFVINALGAYGTMDIGTADDTTGQIALVHLSDPSQCKFIINAPNLVVNQYIYPNARKIAAGNGNALGAVLDTLQPGDTVVIPEGEYALPTGTDNVQGQPGWRFPIDTDNVTIIGTGDTVITNASPLVNGNWADQNLVTIFGDNVTIKNVTIKPVGPIDGTATINKAIEILGKNVSLIDVTIEPLVFSSGKVNSGSIYFSAADVGTALLKNVQLSSWIAAPAATVTAGTITFDGVTLDFRNNVKAVDPAYGVISTNAARYNLVGDGLTVKYDSTLADLAAQITNRIPAGTVVVGP